MRGWSRSILSLLLNILIILSFIQWLAHWFWRSETELSVPLRLFWCNFWYTRLKVPRQEEHHIDDPSWLGFECRDYFTRVFLSVWSFACDPPGGSAYWGPFLIRFWQRTLALRPRIKRRLSRSSFAAASHARSPRATTTGAGGMLMVLWVCETFLIQNQR